MLAIKTYVSLKKMNTFGVESIAKELLCVKDRGMVVEWATQCKKESKSVVVLGQGSNILFVGDFDGLILVNQIEGCQVVREENDWVWVKVGGGESWDDFVERCVVSGWHGLENLSAIPGTVGAAPVQNIGAYGVELESAFQKLNAIDLSTGEELEFDKEACQFGYRDSIFKRKYNSRLFITDVTFRLAKKFVPNFIYADLKKHFSAAEPVTADQMRNAIIGIREVKLPNPKVLGNAGSFFKNPILSRKQFDKLNVDFPGVAHYFQAEGTVKVAAGWLIDQCGLKGYRSGSVGIHDKQALVLVNYGGASGAELLGLAKYIIQTIRERYGITLEIEPKILSV